jgi:hypothetical protein
MIREIQAKSLISHHKEPDCCLASSTLPSICNRAASTSASIVIRALSATNRRFDHDVLVKVNAIELLEKELSRKRVKGTVGTGSMNDLPAA